MKSKLQNLVVLILSLTIVIGSVFCLSSCSSLMFDLIDGIMSYGDENETKTEDIGDQTQNDTQSPEGEGDKTPTVPESGDTSGDNTGTTEEDKELEFYPGMGSVPAENISAKNRTLLSTVVIITGFGNTPSAGSGVIYDIDKETGDAYIITNFHVIYSKNYGYCDSAKLYLYGMRYSEYAIEAKVVGGSANYDIAVLKVEGSEVLKNSYAMAADFGDSEKVRVFDKVYAVGNPEGYGMAATEGIVSVDSESLEMVGPRGDAIELRVIRVSAAINEGNSGGGLYDEDGKLIGIVCAKRIGSEVDNMGYAIPSNLAKNLVDNIIYFCSDGTKNAVQRPLIGITITAKVIGVVADGETGELVKAERIEISELTETCIAKDVVAVGDIVNSISVDGVKIDVTRIHHVIDHMLTARVGSTVVMNVTRAGVAMDVTFTVPESAFTSVE